MMQDERPDAAREEAREGAPEKRMSRTQGLLLSAVFCLVLLAGGLTLLLAPRNAYSETERRPLAQMPACTVSTVLSGSFFEQFGKWTTDHLQPREAFRALKAFWQLRVMRETENNGFVQVNGSIVKLEKQVNEASAANAAAHFREIYETYLKGTGCRIYEALIPDKSYFLRETCPVMDLERMEALLLEALPGAERIPLADTLSLDKYYLTDSHWRQEALLPTAARLLGAMGRDGGCLREDAFTRESYGPFYGVYAGQSALDPPPETIVALSGGPLAGCRLTDLETRQPLAMYDAEHCDPRDLYTLFVGGSRGVLRIENPAAPDEKELILFRDSFGASMAPLLAAGYRTVTLIDLRYVRPALLGRFLRPEGQDVLFLFSATLINNSQGLR